MNASTAAEIIDILGTWRLLAIEEWSEGKCINPFLYGERPNGFIHYLPGNRVAAVIAMDNRKRMTTDYRLASDKALAESARTFSAYAGSYTREGSKLTHHIEVNSYENDVGSDYERHISLEEGKLVLTSPSYGKENSTCLTKAIWRRV